MSQIVNQSSRSMCSLIAFYFLSLHEALCSLAALHLFSMMLKCLSSISVTAQLSNATCNWCLEDVKLAVSVSSAMMHRLIIC